MCVKPAVSAADKCQLEKIPFRFSIYFFIKIPTKYASWTTYLNPMRFSSWIVTLFVLVASAFTLALPFYVKAKSYSNEEDSNISWAFFVITSSLAQQGES